MAPVVRYRLLVALGVATLLLLALAVAGATYSPDTTIPRGLVGRRVQVEGHALRVATRGTGRDVLLIHGSSGSIEDWDAIIDELATRYRVTAYDRPAHGFSDDDGEYSYRHNAEVASALVEKLGLRRAIVVGHSYGGTTALAMALMRTSGVDGYVVLDSSTYRPSRRVTMLYRLLNVPLVGVGVGRVLPSGIAEGKIRAGISDQFRVTPPSEAFLRTRVRIWNNPKVTHAIAAETIGTPGWLRELAPHYPSIVAPVGIVGQRDDAFRRGSLTRLHRDITSSTLTLLPDTGHYVQIERPRDVVSAIDAMAARVPVP